MPNLDAASQSPARPRGWDLLSLSRAHSLARALDRSLDDLLSRRSPQMLAALTLAVLTVLFDTARAAVRDHPHVPCPRGFTRPLSLALANPFSTVRPPSTPFSLAVQGRDRRPYPTNAGRLRLAELLYVRKRRRPVVRRGRSLEHRHGALRGTS